MHFQDNKICRSVMHIPNIITILRFLEAAGLLICNPVGAAFWLIYGLCGLSDILDGYLALKLHAESKTGHFIRLYNPDAVVVEGHRRGISAKCVTLWMHK